MASRLATPFGLLSAACVIVVAGSPAPKALAQPYYRGYGGGYHASTAAEGYARGMADVVRSQGAKNEADSRAAINREEARSRYLDNRTKAAETYWERRKIYQKARAEEQYALSQQRQAQRERVMLKQLTPRQFDTTTGAVDWPALLEDPSYNDFREPLDRIFSTRAKYGALKSDDYLAGKQHIRDWRAAVTARKDMYPEVALRNALRFLLKINRELDDNLG